MFSDANLYEEAYNDAVRHNEKTVAEIEAFKKELEGVKQNLEENPKHLFQHIMAPLAGGKALIKAKLIHTNEILVFLGDKWFVRTSATRAMDICNRRIKSCNENLAEIEKETNRFASNIEKSQEYEIFPNEQLLDISEPYDDEAEKLWREKHRERVREHKRQEAVERDQLKDEDLFSQLNELEEHDEETECVKLKPDISDEILSESDDNLDTTSTDISHVSFDKKRKGADLPQALSDFSDSVSCNEEALLDRHIKKRVSFSDTDDLKCYCPSESVNAVDTNIIVFKHSDRIRCHLPVDNKINSPSDIYRVCMRDFNPKSILKKDAHYFAVTTKISNDEDPFLNEKKYAENCELFEENSADHIEVVFGDIMEKTVGKQTKVEKPSRPMSRFKKSRIENS